jgi:hypothetical protein
VRAGYGTRAKQRTIDIVHCPLMETGTTESFDDAAHAVKKGLGFGSRFLGTMALACPAIRAKIFS